MRAIGAFVVAALCLHGGAASAQEAYAGVLLQYLTGDPDSAVEHLRRLPEGEIRAGLEAFEATRNRRVITGAAAMHTEAAIRRDGGLASNFHLQVATALVEYGERHAGRSNTPFSIRPQYATPVSDEFRRLWYCVVITTVEAMGGLDLADKYIAHARALYPDNAEILLVSGVAEGMRASPRTASVNDGARRKALAAAERDYRAVIAAEPGRLEARLRLARVLQERHQLIDARAILEPLTASEDRRIVYLACLFLGGVEDALQHDDAASALYERAAATLPIAQAARLAASELRHRRGDHAGAAVAIPAAAGTLNVFDPWWTYTFGEYWRVEVLLNALRRMTQG